MWLCFHGYHGCGWHEGRVATALWAPTLLAQLLLLLVHAWSCPQPGGASVPTTLGFKCQVCPFESQRDVLVLFTFR